MIEILLIIYYAIGIVIILKVLKQNNIDREKFRKQEKEDFEKYCNNIESETTKRLERELKAFDEIQDENKRRFL